LSQAGLIYFMEEKIREYLDWKGIHSPRASIMYKSWLHRLIEVCGDKPIEEYSISDVVSYQKWLKTRFSPYSVQYATVVIKNFFKFYRDQNYRCLSPSLIKRVRGSSKSHRAIKEEEFEKMISDIPENEFPLLRDKLIISILWDTGVRVSELCDLDIMQIDTNRRSTVIATKKTSSKRIIVWSDETQRLLARYMGIRSELYRQNCSTTALFVGWTYGKGWSNRLSTRSVERIIKDYAAKAGIVERVTPHSFRHGWAHKRRDMNAPLSFIQRGLGHLNPVSTFVYEQYSDVDFENKANAFLKVA
jgi:integrase/recombinase XerD